MVAKASMQQTESKLIADLELLSRELLSAQDEANRQAYHYHVQFRDRAVSLCVTSHVDFICNQVSNLFCLFQGAMDLQYLHNRFEKGKGLVKKWMDEKHRYVTLSSFTDVYADLAGWLPQNTKQPDFKMQALAS